MPLAVIGGLWIEHLWAGLNALIQAQNRSGLLPGPSLCYLPDLHGLPEPHVTNYQEPKHVYGSFNHTRKLTRATQKRFGAVLSANPDAVLQFRSHSFHDPAVRRHFLQRFSDAGIAAHQLQPLPYAPSSAEAMADYGRIHLHLDSFPVSGTTTTLDSLAMGIPVLTCPTSYYAGAISAAILEHAGLAEHICSDLTSCQLTLVGWQISTVVATHGCVLPSRCVSHPYAMEKPRLASLSNSFVDVASKARGLIL